MLYYQTLSLVYEIIQTELISCYYNNLLKLYFSGNKTRKFISQKYYLASFGKNIEAYIKDCNICLVWKIIKYKFYTDLQSLSVLT